MNKNGINLSVNLENPRELGFDGCGAHTHGYAVRSEANLLRYMMDYGSTGDISSLRCEINEAVLDAAGEAQKVYAFQVRNAAGIVVYNRVVGSKESAEKLAKIKVGEINKIARKRGLKARIKLAGKPGTTKRKKRKKK